MVKVGSKTTGTIAFVDKVAYEVEVIFDETMAVGEMVTFQKGEEDLRGVPINVVNSERSGNIAVKTIKEPIKKIVKVGTLCKMLPKPNPGGGGSTKPSNPPTPGTTDPSDPVNPKPSEPGGSTPDKPVKPNPSKPGGSTPDQPVPRPRVNLVALPRTSRFRRPSRPILTLSTCSDTERLVVQAQAVD